MSFNDQAPVLLRTTGESLELMMMRRMRGQVGPRALSQVPLG